MPNVDQSGIAWFSLAEIYFTEVIKQVRKVDLLEPISKAQYQDPSENCILWEAPEYTMCQDY